MQSRASFTRSRTQFRSRELIYSQPDLRDQASWITPISRAMNRIVYRIYLAPHILAVRHNEVRGNIFYAYIFPRLLFRRLYGTSFKFLMLRIRFSGRLCSSHPASREPDYSSQRFAPKRIETLHFFSARPSLFCNLPYELDTWVTRTSWMGLSRAENPTISSRCTNQQL